MLLRQAGETPPFLGRGPPVMSQMPGPWPVPARRRPIGQPGSDARRTASAGQPARTGCPFSHPGRRPTAPARWRSSWPRVQGVLGPTAGLGGVRVEPQPRVCGQLHRLVRQAQDTDDRVVQPFDAGAMHWRPARPGGRCVRTPEPWSSRPAAAAPPGAVRDRAPAAAGGRDTHVGGSGQVEQVGPFRFVQLQRPDQGLQHAVRHAGEIPALHPGVLGGSGPTWNAP
jgi:hypothetical protein